MNALLAIKPEFAEKILRGDKTFEFRRTTFSDANSIECVYLYASSPVKQIVGVFTIRRVVEAPPEELWELYGDQSGIEKKDRFMDYFEGAETGFGIQIKTTQRLHEPIDPNDMFKDFSPPVSFNYLDSEKEGEIRQQFPKSACTTEAAKLPQFSSD